MFQRDMAATSNPDAVGVAVINYKMPTLRSRAEVLANAHKIRQMVEGLKLGLPGLDLVVFPEHSTQGLPRDQHDMLEIATTIPGDETAVFAQACRNAGVWGVFSITSEQHEAHPHQPPHSTLLLLDDAGQIVQTCRRASEGKPAVSTGPKGMKISLVAWRDCTGDGAELVVHCQGLMQATTGDQAGLASKALARDHSTYVAVANAAGFDGQYAYLGRSAIIGFNGQTLGECGDESYGIQYAQLSKRLLRDARSSAEATGQHLFRLLTNANGGPPSRPADR